MESLIPSCIPISTSIAGIEIVPSSMTGSGAFSSDGGAIGVGSVVVVLEVVVVLDVVVVVDVVVVLVGGDVVDVVVVATVVGLAVSSERRTRSCTPAMSTNRTRVTNRMRVRDEILIGYPLTQGGARRVDRRRHRQESQFLGTTTRRVQSWEEVVPRSKRPSRDDVVGTE